MQKGLKRGLGGGPTITVSNLSSLRSTWDRISKRELWVPAVNKKKEGKEKKILRKELKELKKYL